MTYFIIPKIAVSPRFPTQRGAPDLQFHFQPMSTTGTPAVYLDAFDAFTASVCILRTGRERRERWGEFMRIYWDLVKM